MSTIDEVIRKRKKPGEEGGTEEDDTLDKVMKDSDKILARELKQSSVERMIQDNRQKIEEAKKRTALASGARSETELDISVDQKSAAAFLKALIDSGTEPNKAAAFVKSLDDATLAKIMVMSGSQHGNNLLTPLLFAASSPRSDIKDLVDAATDLVELAGGKGGGDKMTEMVVAFGTMADILRPKGEGGDSTLRTELQGISAKLDEQREAMHARELDFQKQIADMNQSRLQEQLQGINSELEQLRKRDFKAEITDAKATLEAVGLKIGTGEKDALDAIREVTDTIMKAPAVEELSRAVGDRIRTGPTIRPQKAPPGSQTIYCEVCAGSGVRTPLTVTPEMQAGKADLVCPVCGTSYTKQQG